MQRTLCFSFRLYWPFRVSLLMNREWAFSPTKIDITFLVLERGSENTCLPLYLACYPLLTVNVKSSLPFDNRHLYFTNFCIFHLKNIEKYLVAPHFKKSKSSHDLFNELGRRLYGLLLMLRVREAFCPRRRPHSGPIELQVYSRCDTKHRLPCTIPVITPFY